jgi:HK97 family phage major capsid protein
MNIEELKNKRNQLVAAAQLKLGEASKALADGDTEKATALQAELKGYEDQIELYTSQISSAKSLFAEEEEEEPAPPAKSAPVRVPFEEGDSTPEPEANDVNKSVYVLRYGEIDSAVKAVAQDLYGKDYQQKRQGQKDAFVKYLRFGDRHLDAGEERSLKTTIMTPEQIRNDIKSDVPFTEMKATLNEASNELGGFLVPEDYRTQMVKKIADTGIVRRFARKVTTSRDSIEWPKLLGGDDRYTSAVRVTWIEENPTDATKSLTNPNFGMAKIPVNTVMARVDLSRNMLEDSAFNMMMLITELFGEAAGIDEDVQFTTGTGGDTPRGVLGARSGAEYVPLTGIDVVNSGASSTLQPDGIIDLVYDLPQQYRRGSVLMAARSVHATVRKFKATDNQYLWEPSLKPGEPATLLGYSFYENESLPSVAVNGHPIIFGDWSGYVVVDRIGMTVERVVDTTTTGQNKVALFMRRRLGGDVIEPWKFKVQKVAA